MASETIQAAPESLIEAMPQATATPKRRGRPPGSTNKTPSKRGRPRKSMADRIGGVLSMANLLFAFAPPQYQQDALDMTEITAIAKSLDEAAKENAQLYKYLDTALGGTGSAMLNLAIVVACVTGRRFARHGIYIGRDWDDRLGAFIAMSAGPVDAVDFSAIIGSAPEPERMATA